MVPAPGEQVEGVVWSINPSDEIALDRFEDVHLGLYTKHRLPVMLAGEHVEMLVYIDPESGVGVPSPEYVERMRRAIADAALDPAYVARHIEPYLSGGPTP